MHSLHNALFIFVCPGCLDKVKVFQLFWQCTTPSSTRVVWSRWAMKQSWWPYGCVECLAMMPSLWWPRPIAEAFICKDDYGNLNFTDIIWTLAGCFSSLLFWFLHLGNQMQQLLVAAIGDLSVSEVWKVARSIALRICVWPSTRLGGVRLWTVLTSTHLFDTTWINLIQLDIILIRLMLVSCPVGWQWRATCF